MAPSLITRRGGDVPSRSRPRRAQSDEVVNRCREGRVRGDGAPHLLRLRLP